MAKMKEILTSDQRLKALQCEASLSLMDNGNCDKPDDGKSKKKKNDSKSTEQ